MSQKYPTYKGLNLPNVASRVLAQWESEKIFEKSIDTREGNTPFIFFEGPPSANGLPGIHHAMGRSIKDIFCRYKTLKGFQVKRKAGWDTHGLPVELGVEKELGITKEDIGTKISVDEYNKACREAVMRYTDIWNNLTRQMGYWVDMENPYITYDSKYMESVWWLLGQLYEKELIYKGYTIQPYSPKAGTGLSTHELNMPGCYRDVTDTTVVAQFKLRDGETLPSPFDAAQGSGNGETFFLAWTTTPWTLPSNTALTVGPKIKYVLVQTYNQYTKEAMQVILAKNLVGYQFSKNYFAAESAEELAAFTSEDKKIPYYVAGECLGKDLVGLKYEQLLPFALPYENAEEAFRVIPGDFVTTEDGTGIVHTAPTFGADDAKVAADAGVPGLLVLNENDDPVPLVDLQGRFRPEMGEFAGKYVKNEYYADGEAPEKSVDVELAIKLKTENRAFKVEKYVHSYPHCWRTDKPVLYYPLDSWFVKATEKKERMSELNNTINWKPASTGTGRFGKWLENLNDWNLSRSRYWGIPIPIWSTEDDEERVCISSVEQLKAEIDKSVAAGMMDSNPLADFEVGNMSKENYEKVDLHKHYMDAITLVSPSGKPMQREADLIDVWFDSGSMPYAQWHYPFENKELIDNRTGYPADFIAEGVDQTRGWFYTLHAIATMVFDSVAYKAVVSNGLVLDKDGFKMSKSRGNAVDPFETMDKFGPDATRWYMITNAQPWDNLKFDVDGITEVQRKFFGTLYNTYSFFALYANIDGFDYSEADLALEERPEIDRWVLSKLNTLIKEVDAAYDSYEPTKAGRLIQDFVGDQLSNWYVRLGRRRFWKQSADDAAGAKDKLSAYQTLYTCLETVAILGSPIAPFYMDQLFQDLNAVSGKHDCESVHLADFPKADEAVINAELETQMDLAQRTSSLVLGLRKKERLRVRQPLQKIMVPALNESFAANIRHVQDLILSEVNVKELELLAEDNDVLVKSIKPNFKTIGPKYGKYMKAIAAMVNQMSGDDIAQIEANNGWKGEVNGEEITLELGDFDIAAQDIPGWLVSSDGSLTVALDVTLSDELKSEGIARELVNRVQNLRKDSGLEVTDRILLKVDTNELIQNAITSNKEYVCSEVLANDVVFESLGDDALVTDLVDADDAKIGLVKS
ncbi:MAG: isoleucine--tRNA ligase [Fluviicola sp. XM-24bin1]|mgnify:CR=1 FL=1|nr:MAG: isoleucine--tRNA ligase [Fluviicola sp. XM-24bin1]